MVVGGLVQPDRPHEISVAKPEQCLWDFWAFLEILEAPGGPGGPWRRLAPVWKRLETPHMDEAEQPLQTLIYTMAYDIYYVLFMGFAFWVHLIGICGGL